MKYTDPSELFKFIIEKADISVINDNQKCLSVALDLLDSEKLNFKLLKIALKNNVYKELLKAYKSDSDSKTHCIKKAIKFLNEECFIENDKAILAVGWLASVIFLEEWNQNFGKSVESSPRSACCAPGEGSTASSRRVRVRSPKTPASSNCTPVATSRRRRPISPGRSGSGCSTSSTATRTGSPRSCRPWARGASASSPHGRRTARIRWGCRRCGSSKSRG